MKLSKLISSLLAVAMMSATFVTNSFAATATGNEKLVIESEKIDWDDDAYEKYVDDYQDDGYAAQYYVKVSVTGVKVSGKGKKKEYTGSSISGVAINHEITTTDNYDISNVNCVSGGSFNVNVETQGSYAAASAIYPSKEGSISESDVTEVMGFIVSLENDKSATIDFEGSLITITDFNNAVAVGNSSTKIYVDADDIVLGTSAPATKLVTNITVSANDMTVGDADQLPTVVVTPSDATDATYTLTSSNTAVATIEDGKIRAVAAGTTTITATAKDGSNVSGSCDITVSDPTPAGTVITVDSVKGMSTDKKAAAWGLKIESFDSNKKYEATFTDGSKTEKMDIPFANVAGELTVQRIIILKSDSAMSDDVTLNVVCK